MDDKIKELRSLILDNDVGARTDDAYLLRYLNNKYLSVQYAYKRIRRFELYKSNNQDFMTINISRFRQMLNSGTINMLQGTDKKGCHISYCRPGHWSPDKFYAEDLLQISFVLTYAAMIKYKEDFKGLAILYDFENFGFKQLTAVSPRFAKKMVELILDCVPFPVYDIHVAKQSKLFSILYACFKPFLKEKSKQMIKCYGYDLSVLHEHIDKSVLPEELEGSFKFSNPAFWLDLIESREVVKDLEKSGFIFIGN